MSFIQPTQRCGTYANAGDTPGKLLIVTTPGGYEAFCRDVDRLGAGGPPAEGAFREIVRRHGLEIVGPSVLNTP